MILVDTDSTTGGKAMAVRLVVTFHAAPSKGAELAQAMKARCEISRQDAGCEQFEVFQSVFDPDKLVLLELWKDQAARSRDRKCTRLNSSHVSISYAVFCLKKKKK